MSETEEDEQDASPSRLGGIVWALGAVVLGVSVATCGMLGYVLLGQKAEAPADQYLVLGRNIAPGEAIGSADIAAATGLEVPGAVRSVEEAVGRIASEPLYAGDPLLGLRLAPAGRPPGVMSLTPKGDRSLWILQDSGVAGLGLESGDHVDVWALGARDDEIEPLARAALVLAVEPPGPAQEGRVTLSVSAEESGAVTRARGRRAELGLALRSDHDTPREFFSDPLKLLGAEPTSGPVGARVALAPGDPIRAEDLIHLPTSGAAMAPEIALEAVVGRIPHRLVFAGEQLHETLLADAAVGRGLSALLPLSDRAISVSVVGNPPELFAPGNTIDALDLRATPPETLASELEVVGYQGEADGCPCAVIRVPEQLVGNLLWLRSQAKLGIAVP